jgi:hypothetical protein
MHRVDALAAVFALAVGAVVLLSACSEAETPAHDAAISTPAAPTAPEAAITVVEPKPGDWVKIPMTVKGTASVFEGTVVIAVESADGSKTFCRTLATASEGAPGRGSFEAQIAFPPPYEAPTDARLQVYSENPANGSVQNLVSVPFVIWHILPPLFVESPLCGDEVKSPVRVAVTYAVEGELIVVIKDSSGSELARTVQQVYGREGGRGTLIQDLDFSLPDGPQAGTIEAFSSPREGIVENVFSVPVALVP